MWIFFFLFLAAFRLWCTAAAANSDIVLAGVFKLEMNESVQRIMMSVTVPVFVPSRREAMRLNRYEIISGLIHMEVATQFKMILIAYTLP